MNSASMCITVSCDVIHFELVVRHASEWGLSLGALTGLDWFFFPEFEFSSYTPGEVGRDNSPKLSIALTLPEKTCDL